MYKMKMMSQNLSDGLSDERQELQELLFATKNGKERRLSSAA